MDGASFDAWLAVAERVALWVAGGIGFAIANRQRLLKVIAGVRTGCDLVSEFGPAAASEIKAQLDLLSNIKQERLHRETERQHFERTVSSALQIGIFRCDTDGRCVWTNDWLCKAFGMSLHEMTGNGGFGWLKAVGGEDRERVHNWWQHCTSNSMPYSADYTVENQATGRHWDARAQAMMFSEDGEPAWYIGVVRPRIVSWDSDPAKPPRMAHSPKPDEASK